MRDQTPDEEYSMYRRKWIKSAAALGITGFAGCLGGDGEDTPSEAGEDDTVIEYWRWPHSTEPSNTAEDEIVDQFNEEDNGYYVDQNTTPFDDYESNIRSVISAEDAPEVGWSTGPNRLYDTSGKSREEIAEEAPFAVLGDVFDDEFMDQFFDVLWADQLNQFNAIIGLPFIGGFDPGLIYVNVEVWEEAGLGELPEDNWSIEEFQEAIEALQGTEFNGTPISGWGLGYSDVQSSGRWEEIEQYSRLYGKVIGPGYLNKDDEYVLTMADDAMRDALLDFFQTPVQNDWTNNVSAFTFHEMVEQFYNGQVAMFAHEEWAQIGIDQNSDFEFETIPWPTLNGEDFNIYTGSTAYMLAFDDDVGGNVDAAAEYMQFRNNVEGSKTFFNTSAQPIANREAIEQLQDEGPSGLAEEIGAMPTLDAVINAYEGMEVIPEMQEERYPDIQSYEENGFTIVEQGIPTGAGGGELENTTGELIERMWRDDIDVEDGLVEMEEQWADILEDDGHDVNRDSIGFNAVEPSM